MRMSDWRSDVCSSDLRHLPRPEEPQRLSAPRPHAPILFPSHLDQLARTSHPVSADPAIERWLHGTDLDSEQADVQVVWRADLDEGLLELVGTDGSPELSRDLSGRIAASMPLLQAMLRRPIRDGRKWRLGGEAR